MDQQNPLVSVVVIFLNAERFLDEAIHSVLAQTYEEWELLLVDDGSSDGSSQIARGYAQSLPQKIRYLEHDAHANRGMSASRNLGIAHARGEYIAFLDADDVWLPDKLREQVAMLQNQPDVAMLCGATEYWHSWTGRAEDARRDRVRRLGLPHGTVLAPPEALCLLLQRRLLSPATCSILARREVVQQIGGFEDSFRGMYEDQAFYAKLFLAAPVLVANTCWDRYRQHPESCYSTARQNGQSRPARQVFIEWLRRYVQQRDVHDPRLWGLIQRESWALEHPRAQRTLRWAREAPRQLLRSCKALVRRVMPASLWHRLRAARRRQAYVPPPGHVRLGHLRRLTPFSTRWGGDRGLPIDRYYIERFLASRAADIRGRTLEVADDLYTRRFGSAARRDVLHVDGSPKMTIRADLACAPQIPADTFDCFVCTQTLQLIADMPAALRTIHRILKPGGVLLATLPGISRLCYSSEAPWGDYWRLTTFSAEQLFRQAFPGGEVQVQAWGNVLSATAFLYGMATEELTAQELDHCDPHCQVLITVQARKADDANPNEPNHNSESTTKTE